MQTQRFAKNADLLCRQRMVAKIVDIYLSVKASFVPNAEPNGRCNR